MNTSASWRVAFRAARRLVRSHPLRSLLIAALIALPVFGLSADAVIRTSPILSDSVRLDRQIGAAPAAVLLPSDVRELGLLGPGFANASRGGDDNGRELGAVLGTGNGDFADLEITDALVTTAADGYAVADPWTTERVEATVGSPVVATRFASTSLQVGDPAFSISKALFADGDDPLLGSSVELVSGRWPSAPDEVAMSAWAVHEGQPSSGTLPISLRPGEPEQTFDIVGVANASVGHSQFGEEAVAVFALDAAPQDAGWRWLIDRKTPLGLAEATDLTAYGLSVISRDVGPADEGYESDPQYTAIVNIIRAALTAAILLLTMFLAAPAFAISATERRRDLALLYAQGARPADLRRHVLAYGALIAGTSTVIAGVVGTATAFFYFRWAVAQSDRWLPPVEVPWLIIASTMAAAFVGAMVAAWLPARRVIRSASLPTARVERTSQMQVATKAVMSAVVLTVGVVALIVGARDEQSSMLILGIALTTAAGLSGTPAVLVGVGRWARRGPLAVRMAIADISRHRSRSTPAVAAIASVVGVMVVFASVAEASSGLDSRAGLVLPQVLVLVTIVMVIALAATLIVTALTTSYNMEASTTLDTIGATTSVRRTFAATYAATIAGIGAALGTVFGLAIGWACAWWTITGQQLSDNGLLGGTVSDFVSIPWAWLALSVVLPVLAYGLAWLMVRPAHTLRPALPAMHVSH